MVEGVALVREHGLTVEELLIVVLIVQGGGGGPTSADGEVWGDSTGVVVLLALVKEEALEVALAHAWLAVSHDVDVAFGCDLTRPSHGQDLLIVLDRA